jgi:hypothetical protein
MWRTVVKTVGLLFYYFEPVFRPFLAFILGRVWVWNGIFELGPRDNFPRHWKSAASPNFNRYVLGINSASHNSGISLVQVNNNNHVEVLCVLEEERFSAKKHDSSFPVGCFQELGKNSQNLQYCL